MSEAMIEVQGLRKRYGAFEALRGVSFTVDRGEVVGFLGPNGAGKSTTMKILTGYLAATEGSVAIAGLDAYEKSLQARAKIGYLPESNPLYLELVVYDFLRYVGRIRGLSRGLIEERIKSVGARCGLKEVIGKEIGALSKGLRQRVGLAQALLHDPPVLILDEPTTGLDPNQIVEIRQLIRELGQDHTVILSTHNLPEVMQTCNRVIIVHRGGIVADGTADELQAREREKAGITLDVAADYEKLDDVAPTLRSELPVSEVERTAAPGVARFLIAPRDGADIRRALFDLAARSSWPVVELHRPVPDLEQIFHRLTRD